MVRKLIILMCLSLAILTSCETDKKNLEKAKAEISELTAKNQQLADVKGHLETDKSALTQEIAQLKDQNVALGAERDQLKNNISELVRKNEAIQKKSEQTDAEVTKLKKQKDELMAKIVDLNKKSTPNPDHVNKFGDSDKQTLLNQQSNLTPCDALIEYMRKCRSIVENYKGGERKSKLEETRISYAAKMTEAPVAGRKAAIEWVKELNRSWDRHPDDNAPRLVRFKNAALKACGKTAAEAGF
jgi:septal ring factor EnvC (AmiA/AmiB activator)